LKGIFAWLEKRGERERERGYHSFVSSSRFVEVGLLKNPNKIQKKKKKNFV